MARLSDIDRLALEAGVSPAMFSQAFLDTLSKFKAQFNWDSHRFSEILTKGRYTFSRRRAFLLPLSCAPEDLHREKDRWTFVVWICFLLSETADISATESFLQGTLDAKTYAWLATNPNCLDVIDAFHKGENNPHTVTMRRILSLPENPSNEVNNKSKSEIMSVDPQQNPIKELSEEEINSTGPTKRDLGEKFIRFLAENHGNLPLWAKSTGDFVDVESPKGFKEYAAHRGENWMAVQQGVQKMRIHQPDPEGKPFIRVNGKNVIRLKAINLL
jgi:hypothetical protein